MMDDVAERAMDFDARLAADAALVAARLARALADFPDEPVVHAMRHAVRGGKGLRGFLVLEGARVMGVAEERALAVAAAVEAAHAYSLVHDDLPAMDDDDLRRGQPAVHVTWGVATAILAGDALQALAFELLSGPELADAAPALVGGLARAIGARGMVLGQALDIAAESAEAAPSLAEITALQAAKTGALITFSATAGALLAGRDPAPLARFAQALGLAFQIRDDVLDVEGDARLTGKRVRKDAAAGKATFVGALGLAGAKAWARALVHEAEEALAPYGAAAGNLVAAARFSIARMG